MSIGATKERLAKQAHWPRGGGVTAFVLFAIPVLMACVALALDIALVSYQSRQMQTSCDAAALAGVVELLDQSPLYSDGLTAEVLTTVLPAGVLLSDDKRVASARAQAQAYAATNAVGGGPLELDPNEANQPDGDLVVGWVEEPQSLACPMSVWEGEGPINSLLVRGNRLERRGNAVTFWVGQLFGLRGVDLTTSARATIDQQVYGVRPNGHVPIPLIPIVMQPNSPDSREAADSTMRPKARTDAYTVDDRTGAVMAGPDGIREIELTMPAGAKAKKLANAWLVHFEPGAPPYIELQRQIEQGYNLEDLQFFGGQLAIGTGPLPTVDVGIDVPATSLVQSLLAVRGEKRVWLLGDRPNEAGQCSLSGFFAGRVVSCAPTTEGGIQVVMQPCVLATCTALVGADCPHNPWIAKVTLSQ